MDSDAADDAGKTRTLRLAVLGSGRGSNLQAILDAISDGRLDAEVVLVIADRAGARILDIAGDAGVATFVSGEKYSEAEVVDRLAGCGADLVILAGFMRIIRATMLDAWPRRILNIHPSLLPKFPGLRAWQQALDAGESEAGCTVHVVDAGVDSGPVLGQASVPVLDGDDADKLHARIQEQEHQLYPRMIRDYGAKVLAGRDV